jgi:MFS family permease
VTHEAPPIARTAPLPRGVAFVTATISMFLLTAAAGAGTPLFVVYEAAWNFPAWMLTVAFAAYALGNIVALLVLGSLSDHIGRRRALFIALAIVLVSSVVFAAAPNIGWIIAARTIQGIGTGAATSVLTAYIIELAPDRLKNLGGALAGSAPMAGIALGALSTGLLVQLAGVTPAEIFVAFAIGTVLSIIVMTLSPETNPGKPGVRAALIPRITIPAAARATFAAAVPAQLGAWMLAGLYLGLAPSIIQGVFGVHDGALNGLAAFLLPALASAAGVVMSGRTAATTRLLGSVLVVVGTLVFLGSIATGWLPLLFIGSAIGGIGFGSSFTGTLRGLAPLVESNQRAGLFAGVLLSAYIGYGVPAIVAGQFIVPVGFTTVSAVYGAVIVVLVAIGGIGQVRASSRVRTPAASVSK